MGKETHFPNCLLDGIWYVSSQEGMKKSQGFPYYMVDLQVTVPSSMHAADGSWLWRFSAELNGVDARWISLPTIVSGKSECSGWPSVGNEGINLYIGILGIHSLIPYYTKGQLV